MLLVVELAGGVVRDGGIGIGLGVRRKGSINALITEMISSTIPPRKQNSPSTAPPPLAAPVSCTELELVGKAPVTLIVPCHEMMREITPTNTRMVASVNSHWDFISAFEAGLDYLEGLYNFGTTEAALLTWTVLLGSDSHWHHDIPVLVIVPFARPQLAGGLGVFELKAYLA